MSSASGSTITARNRTGAGIARERPEQPRQFSQPQLRDRRRKRLVTNLTVMSSGPWLLDREIAAVCDDLARRVAAQPDPARWWRKVDAVRDGVHAVVSGAVGVLAEADARRAKGSLHNQSARSARDLAQRPTLVELTDGQLSEGTWTAALTAMAEPISRPLSKLIANAASSVVSERLLATLVELDQAALDLSRLLDRSDRVQKFGLE